MKIRIAILSIAACTLIAGSATAQRQSDDVGWVNQCVRDSSADRTVSEQVKIMYCTCMVAKMSDNETRSVTQWEQANPAARDDCAKRAGWN